MNKSTVIIILFLALIGVGVFWYFDRGDLKEQLEIEHKIQDSLKIRYGKLIIMNDSLLNLEGAISFKRYKTTNKLKKQVNETDAIPGIVATYSDRKLDSILTNHRFKARKKSSDSIND